ncbi:MAG: D-alanyl-D-alanine dipeptidase [Rhabdochlamydiaceae bacterium]|nr:D-alanyl-D-alanine dipeptidase [Rhabdochlamydiaceae bacterium]
MIQGKKWVGVWGLAVALIHGGSALAEESSYEPALLDVQSVIPQVQVDLKYATTDNFTGQIVYDFDRCLLLKEVVDALCLVQAELEELGFGLKIWDGFRPVAAQWKFWELVPDERYVSDPRKGGRHTRGTAVDLTLITTEGTELPMPSLFDDFSEKAHRNYQGASYEEISNRKLLEEVMEKHGFVGLPTEWWHFDLIGWEKYPPIVSQEN